MSKRNVVRAVEILRDDEFMTVEEIVDTLLEEGISCERINVALRLARRYPTDRPQDWNR